MSQDLARQVARQRGAYLPIVMATIEAETNFRNVLGQYAAPTAVWGAGYGQVHLRWHLDTFRQVARELGVDVPPNLTTRRDDVQRYVIDNIILRNDLLSMHLAVAVIQRIWEGSGSNWDRFTEAYVGAGISTRDRERRRVIWNRWRERLGGEQQIPAPPAQAPPTPVTPPIGRVVIGDEQYRQVGLLAVSLATLLLVLITGGDSDRDET